MIHMKRDRKRRKLNSLLHGNNDGDALILVVVVMFVVMLLGIAILYSSYMSVVLRSSQRRSEKTFTSAETGMEMIREGLMETNSDAVAEGYNELLSHFNSDDSKNKDTFKNAYLNAITRADKGGTALFPGPETGPDGTMKIRHYNIEALRNYLNGHVKKGDAFTLDAIVNGQKSDKGQGVVHVTDSGNVIIRGVRLTYKGKGGYEEQITTDFRLKVPEASVNNSYIGFDDQLRDFSVVADKGFQLYPKGRAGARQPGCHVEGSAYAGNIVLGESTLTVSKNRIFVIGQTREMKKNITNRDASGNITGESVSKVLKGTEDKRTSGNVIFTGSSEQKSDIVVEEGATLWANNIVMKQNSSFEAKKNSHIYVQNDLNFRTGGIVSISGNYYGFGNDPTDPQKSSSIVFNQNRSLNENSNPAPGSRYQSRLDISNIQSMTLAGTSFVMEGLNEHGRGSVKMGSSITTRPEQLAYLVPVSLINSTSGTDTESENSDSEVFTNPRIISIDDEEANNPEKDRLIEALDDSAFKSPISGMDKALVSYGISNKKTDIKMLTYNIPGNTSQCIRYYFFNFNDQKDANDYFRDYFKNNSSDINSYISSYADLAGFDQNGSKIRSAGTTITGEDGNFDVIGGSDNTSEAESLQKNYRHLSETMSTNTSGDTTPFYHFIDVDELHKHCGKKDGKDHPIKVENVSIRPTRDSNSTYVNVHVVWGDAYIGTDVPANNPDTAFVVDGDAHISGNFQGIIICSGMVYGQSGGETMKLDNSGIAALKKTNIWKQKAEPSEPVENKGWEDVTYENWKKD